MKQKRFRTLVFKRFLSHLAKAQVAFLWDVLFRRISDRVPLSNLASNYDRTILWASMKVCAKTEVEIPACRQQVFAVAAQVHLACMSHFRSYIEAQWNHEATRIIGAEGH